jgi:hypothetical protein
VSEQDLDTEHDTLRHLRDEGLVAAVDLGADERGLSLAFTSWNHVAPWIRRIKALRRAE